MKQETWTPTVEPKRERRMITARIDKALADRIDKQAAKENCTRTNMIEVLLDRGLRIDGSVFG